MVTKPVVELPKFIDAYCPVCKSVVSHAVVYRREPAQEDKPETLHCTMCLNKTVMS